MSTPVDVTGGRKALDFAKLTRKQKRLIGLAGAHGWHDFRWGSHLVGEIVARNDKEEFADGYFRVRMMDSWESPDADFIASIYLASIGQSLDGDTETTNQKEKQ